MLPQDIVKILLVKGLPFLSSVGELARVLLERGHDVHLLVPRPWADLAPLRLAGAKVHCFEFRFWHLNKPKNWFPALRAIVRFHRLLAVEKFDVINTNLIPGRLLARFTPQFKTPIVSTVHGFEELTRTGQHLNRLTHFRDARTVAVSYGVARHLPDFGLSPEVIYNGINCDLAEGSNQGRDYLHKELKLPSTVPLVGMVAFFYREGTKGHEVFLRAAQALLQRCPEVHFVLVGDDIAGNQFRAHFQRRAEELGLGSRVHFLGLRLDVFAILKSLSVHVLASPREGFGLSLAEGMAAGVPSVASRVASLTEIIEDRQSGLFFEPGSPLHLADRVEEILRAPELAQKLAEGGPARIRKSFSLTQTVNEYERLFLRVIAEKEAKAGIPRWLRSGVRRAAFSRLLGPFCVAYYRCALKVFVATVRIIPEVERIYLRRGMTDALWAPGFSDIDLTVLIRDISSEEQAVVLKKIAARTRLLRRFFPVLDAVGADTLSGFELFRDEGEGRRAEISHWSLAFERAASGPV